MVAKRSDRNKKKATALMSQTGSQRKPEDMTIQERKSNIQKNGEQIKLKLLEVSEKSKDAVKGVVNIYIKELMAYEDAMEKKDLKIKELETLLTKNKITLPAETKK